MWLILERCILCIRGLEGAVFIPKKGDPCFKGVAETTSKWESKKTAHFLTLQRFLKYFETYRNSALQNLFSSYILAVISNYFCYMSTIWSLKRECGGVCCCIHWASLGCCRREMQGRLPEEIQRCSQGCPPCTAGDSDCTWPGLTKDVPGVQQLAETNPGDWNEDSNSVPGSQHSSDLCA